MGIGLLMWLVWWAFTILCFEGTLYDMPKLSSLLTSGCIKIWTYGIKVHYISIITYSSITQQSIVPSCDQKSLAMAKADRALINSLCLLLAQEYYVFSLHVLGEVIADVWVIALVAPSSAILCRIILIILTYLDNIISTAFPCQHCSLLNAQDPFPQDASKALPLAFCTCPIANIPLRYQSSSRPTQPTITSIQSICKLYFQSQTFSRYENRDAIIIILVTIHRQSIFCLNSLSCERLCRRH